MRIIRQLSELEEEFPIVSNEYTGIIDYDDEPFTLVSTPSAEPQEATMSTESVPNDKLFVVDQLTALMKDEWEAIEGYNSAISLLQDYINESHDKSLEAVKKILDDIVNEESTHVGQLQGAIGSVYPNMSAINNGVKEAEEQIASTFQPLKVNQSNYQNGMQVSPYDDDPYMAQCSISDIDDTF